MLEKIDEILRTTLTERLAGDGYPDVEVAFEAPSNDWSGRVNGPTVNAFLYDVRESTRERPQDFRVRQVDGRTVEAPPPLLVEASYAITAWAQAAEDEHRLLGGVLGALHAARRIPLVEPVGGLDALDLRVGRPAEGRAEFWNAVGGRYRPSIDVVITLPIESSRSSQRGLPVRKRVVRMADVEVPGRVRDEVSRNG